MSGNVLINKKGHRLNSYYVWDYAEGRKSYDRSMLVDLTQPPGEVCLVYVLFPVCMTVCCTVNLFISTMFAPLMLLAVTVEVGYSKLINS